MTPAIAGRPLLTPGGTTIQNLNILPREAYFLPYERRVDVRLTRRFKVRNYRFAPALDIINLFNANTPTKVNETCCAANFLRPLTIMPSRQYRLAMGVDW